MPAKTALTVLTFIGLILLPQVAPALKNYKSLDPRNIAMVWDLPIPKPKSEPPIAPVDLKGKRLEPEPPSNLVDPKHALDHFYESLLKNGTTRIAHYGDSP